MKLLYYDNKEIEFSNENEEFVFSNLAQKEGFKTDYKGDNWALSKYTRKFDNQNLELCITADFYENFNYSDISLFFVGNRIVRRMIILNDDKSVNRDVLIVTNPILGNDVENYYVKPKFNTSINNYLSNFPLVRKVYRNYKASMVNNVLPDFLIYDFLNYNKIYSSILNQFGKDYDKIKEILDSVGSKKNKETEEVKVFK